MKRIINFILIPTLFLTLTLCTKVSAETPNSDYTSEYTTGLVWDSWETINSHYQEAPPVESELPSSVSLKDTFPTPGKQGIQNSCAAWATAYALRSHQEEVKQEWGLHTDSHLFSPSYVYNQLNGGVNNGISVGVAMGLIVDQGVCTLESFPYNELDYITQPTAEQKSEAESFKVKKWYSIKGTDSIKRRLSNGDGVVIGIEIFSDFDNISPANPIFDVINGTSRGAHAVCLIGYDDEKSAFEFINSWGTEWGLDGYGWISYNLINDVRVNQYGEAVGYVMDPIDTVFSENFFNYTVLNEKATIIGYSGNGGDVVIPDTLGGYPVTSIAENVFQYNTSLTSVIISDNISSIASNAFKDCTSLSAVYIGSSLVEIGTNAFYNCIALTDFSVDENNPYYSGIDGVLYNKSLTSLALCPAGKSGIYKVLNNVSSIENSAFSRCKALTGIILPDSIEIIGAYAFSDCTSLTDIILPDSVIYVGSFAFSNCTALTDITLGNGIREISNGMFSGCRFLKSIALPDNMTSIGAGAFSDCMKLNDIFIPDSVTSIGDFAFHCPMAIEWTWYYPLPNLTIHCFKNSYAHTYAIENNFPFSLIFKASSLSDSSIIVSHITAANTTDGCYNITADFEQSEEIFFCLAIYEGERLIKTYIADDNAQINNIPEADFLNGRIFIWDKNMLPCIEVIYVG